MKTTELILFTPHEKQREIIKLLERDDIYYVCVNAGRRFGKSMLALNWIVKELVNNSGTRGILVSVNHSQVKTLLYDLDIAFSDTGVIKQINKSDKIIYFKNGSILKCFVAFNHDRIRGERVDFAVLDEFAMYDNQAWEASIQPTLATSKRPKVLFISTPRGRGLWFNLFNLGYDAHTTWANYTAKSEDNPCVQREWLDDMREQASNRIWRQEYLAEFIDDGGEVFEGLDACLTDNLALTYNRLYIGIDIGIKNDYSVIYIQNENLETVFCERFLPGSIDRCVNWLWKILQGYDYHNYFIDIETNRFDSVYTELKNRFKEIKVNPDRIMGATDLTHNEKNKNVEQLSILIEQQRIKIIRDPYLVSELRAFTFSFSKSNAIIYGAPDGLHDDMVMAMLSSIRCFNNNNRAKLVVL